MFYVLKIFLKTLDDFKALICIKGGGELAMNFANWINNGNIPISRLPRPFPALTEIAVAATSARRRKPLFYRYSQKRQGGGGVSIRAVNRFKNPNRF